MYSARTPAGGAYRFGTSGLLYRSNKLMYDRQTFTLWSNLTGEPVVGRLAGSNVRLQMLPVALTTWDEWRRRHPDTTVVTLDDDHGAQWNFDYRPGAADRARLGVSFPVWRRSTALPRGTEVFGLRLGGAVKAYPVDAVARAEVINDTVGGATVVVLGDRRSGAVRAYERGPHTMSAGAGAGDLLDEAGRRWRVDEHALVPVGAGDAARPAELDRLAGHVAFWFAWYAFFPQTEVYSMPTRPKTDK